MMSFVHRSYLMCSALLLCAVPALSGFAHESAPPQSQSVDASQEHLALPNLPVTNQRGQRGGFRDMVGTRESLILSFSYTACKSLCNVTNAVLMGVDDSLRREGTDTIHIVSIAIDPRRDTPEALQREAETFNASAQWLWLTGGPEGTQPLLDMLRFPPGELEDHDPIFLIGRPCRGLFTRIIGLPDPDKLIDIAKAQPPCAD